MNVILFIEPIRRPILLEMKYFGTLAVIGYSTIIY